MLAITHLLVVLLFIRALRLDKQEAFAALMFGVLIDLDHLFAYPTFISKEGIGNAFNWHAALNDNIEWKSLMHQPVAAIVVAPVAIGFRLLAPLLMWGLHLLLDYVQTTYLGVASVWEFLFLSVLLVAFGYLEYQDFRERSSRKVSLPRFVQWEGRKVRAYLARLKPSFRLPPVRTGE